jgi:hemerythrin superfamily protein
MADGYEMLSEDHREVERLFDTYRHDPEDSIARDICSRLSVHTRVEEAALYPALRRYVDGGDDLADVAEQEHAVAKSIIARIDGSSPEQLFDLVTELRSEVEHHVESEESELFPQMRESGVDAGVLGAEIAGARRVAEANTAR